MVSRAEKKPSMCASIREAAIKWPGEGGKVPASQ